MRSPTPWLALVALAALAPVGARAQAPTDAEIAAADVAAARRSFAVGVQAATEERWDDALVAFRRAYRLAPRLPILFNLAGAQVQTGHLVEGIASYRRFLREAPVALLDTSGDAARRALEGAERRLAHVRVVTTGVRPSDRIRLDDRALDADELDGEIDVDPGSHEVRALRGGHVIGRVGFTVGERERTVVTLGAHEDGHDDDRGGSSILSSPWLWVGVGVVVAASITAAIVLSPGEPDLYSGNFPPGHLVVQ